MPPGLEGMIPPGSMGAGAPGGAYGEGGGTGGKGLLPGIFGGIGGVYGGVDYLYWVPKSQDIRFPLVTTSAAADFGIPGLATTVGLCGPNDDITYDQTNGFRVWLGWGLSEGGMACEVGGFWLEPSQRRFTFVSNSAGLPVLAVPFISADTLTSGAYLVAFPGINSGFIDVQAETKVRSAEANLVYNAAAGGEGEPGGLSLFAGFRFLQLEESLQVVTQSQTFGVPPLAGNAFFPGAGGFFAGTFFGPGLAPFNVTTTDRIRTFNDFYGGQVGFRGDIGFGKWFAQATGKVAVGYMRSYVDLEGDSTLVTSTGLVSTQPGGLFNAPSDLCRHHKDRLGCLGEGGLNVGCQLGGHCRIHVGYTFLFVNSVVRPTSSLSPVVNPALVPVSPAFTGSFPANNFIPRDITKETEFYLHGLNVGVQFSF